MNKISMLSRNFNNRILTLTTAVFVLAIFVLAFFNTVISDASAQPNQQINYQGKLTDTTGVAVENDDYNLRFFLYDTPGVATTSAIWTEEWLVSATNGVDLQNGLFSIMLGSTTPLSSVDFNQTLYLGVEIGGTTTVPTWDGEMSPRKILGTVPAAFEAQQLSGLGTTSFLRADQADTMSTSSASALLTLIQNGAGAIFAALNSSAETVFGIFESGIVTVGTSTDANIATSTGLAVYNKDVEILPGDPVKISSNFGLAQRITVSGNYAYVGAGGGGLNIFDISDPTVRNLVGNVDNGGYARGVTTDGNYAYVADGGRLEIVDISNPSNPIIVGSASSTGDYYGVTVVANYAYVANGSSGLQIIDISDVTNPQIVADLDDGGFANDIVIRGNFAYVADSSNGLEIIDISDPTNPFEVGDVYDGSGFADGVAISGNYAYVADSSDGLEIIDISDPVNPIEVGGFDDGGDAGKIVVVGNYAFIADGADGLEVIDISSSTNPVEVGQADDSDVSSRGIAISGNYVYVAEDVAGFEIFDIGGLITPTAEIGNLLANDVQSDFVRVTQALNTASLNVGGNAMIGGALTVTGTASSSLQAGNSNAALVVTSGNVGIGTTSPFADLSVDGDVAITGGIYDNTASLGLSGWVLQSTGSGFTWVATSSLGITSSLFTDGGDISYLTSLTDILAIGTSTNIATSTGLAVYNRDIEILAGDPVGVGSITDGANGADELNGPRNVLVSGDYAYVASNNDNGVQILDISDPTNPIGVGSIDDLDAGGPYELNGARGIDVVGNYAYIASYSDNGVQILDISDPTNPIGVGSITDGANGADELEGAQGIVVSGDYAYISSTLDDGVQILDISDPTNPIGVGSITDGANGADELDGAIDIVVVENYAYVASRFDNGVQILDISDPTNPIGVGSITDGANGADELEGAAGLDLSGSYLYVAGRTDNGVQILDISDPTNPIGVGSITEGANGADELTEAQDVVVAGNYAFVASYVDDGIQVIDISSSTNPIGVGSITDGANGANELQGAHRLTISGNYLYVSAFDDNAIQILDLGGLITPTAEIGNLLANDIETDYLRVTQSLVTDGSLNVGTNALIGGSLTITGNSLYPELSQNLVAHWTFDSVDLDFSSTTAEVRDVSGNNYSGDFRNPNSTEVQGIIGEALTFDGVDDSIFFDNDPSLSGTTDFTTSLWVKTTFDGATAGQNGMGLLSQRDPGWDGGEYLINIGRNYDGGDSNPGEVLFVVWESGPQFEIWSGTRVDDGEWHHISTVREGEEGRLYIDGILAASATGTPIDSLNASYYTVIGRDELYEDREYRGDMDDVRIYDRALSSSEINSLYSLGVAPNPALTVLTGNVGIGTTSPFADLSIDGDLAITSGLYDSNASAGLSGQYLQTTGVLTQWVEGASLGISEILFTDNGDITSLDSLTDVLAIGTSTGDIATSTGLAVYNKDIEILAGNPVGLGEIANGAGLELNGPRGFDIVGDLMYIAAYDDDGFQILDVSDPTNPIGIGFIQDETNGADTLGGPTDVKVVSNYAYVTAASPDFGVQVIDVSDPTNPIGVGSIVDGTNGADELEASYAIAVQGNYAYVAGRDDSGMQVLDISDPTNPVGVGSINDSTLNGAHSIIVRGNYAYISSIFAGEFKIIDISDPTNPVARGDVFGMAGRDIALSGNYAYVADYDDDQLEIVDVSDPDNPAIVGTLTDDTNGATTLNGANGVTVIGNYAYVASNLDNGIQVVDISSSTNPIGVGSINDGTNGATELQGAWNIEAKGNYIYVTGWEDDGIQILDLGGLITPTAEIGNLLANDIQTDYLRVTQSLVADGSLNVGQNAMIGGTLTVVGNASSSLQGGTNQPALAVTSGNVVIGSVPTTTDIATSTGLAVYNRDIEILPGNPVRVGATTTSPDSGPVVVVGDYAYMTVYVNGGDEFEIYDVSDPTSPIKIGGVGTASLVFDLEVVGNYAYLAMQTSGGDEIEIFDIADPTNPTKIGGAEVAQTAYGLDVVGNYIYVVSNTSGTDDFEIFDISDPTNPVRVGGLDRNLSGYEVMVVGNYAYVGGVSGSTDDLSIYDVSDPTNPFIVGSDEPDDRVQGIDVSGNYMYIVTEEAGDDFDIYDISDPANPAKTAGLDIRSGTASHTNAVIILGDYAFVGTDADPDDNEILIIDISSSTNPVIVGGANSANGIADLYVAGNYIYVTGGDTDNFQIYDLGGLITPTAEIGNLLANDISTDYLRVTQSLTTDGSLNVGTNALIGGALTITGGGDTDPIFASDLLAYWTFDTVDLDLSSSTSEIKDASGNGYDGDWLNHATTTVAGQVGEAIDFDGTDDYIDFGDVDAFDTATALTVCAWVNHDTIDEDDAILSTVPVGNAEGFILWRDDDGNDSGRTDTYTVLVADDADGDEARVEGATGISSTGVWTHVCASFEASSATGLRLYVDGVEDANSPTSVSNIASLDSGSQSLWVGNWDATSKEFDGAIDDVRIYERVLTASEINDVYTNTGENTKAALTVLSGNVGIGTTSPYADLSIDGDLAITGGIYDSTASLGTTGDVFSATGGATAWNSLAALGLLSSTFTDGGDITYLTSLTDVLAVGTTTDIATSTGVAVYNKDIEILFSVGTNTNRVGSISDNENGADHLNGPKDIAIAGDYAYVVSGGDDGMQVLDISDPTNPIGVGSLSDSGSVLLDNPIAIEVRGNYAYVSSYTEDGMQVIDISDPTNPVGVGSIGDGQQGANSLQGNWSMDVAGNYAFVASFDDDAVQIIDISDPTNPIGVSTMSAGGANDVHVVGNYAYVVSYSWNQLRIFDISDIANPVLTGNVGDTGAIALSGAAYVQVRGKYAYVSSFAEDGLVIIDISDPTNPVALGSIADGQNGAYNMNAAEGFDVLGNYAFVPGKGSDQGVQVIDMSSTSNPVGVGVLDTGAGASDIIFYGNYAYVLSNNAVQVFDLGGLIAPTAEIGNLLAEGIESDYLRVTQALVADASLNVGTNAMIGGTLTVVGNASSSLQGGTTQPALAVTSGNVVIGSVPTTTDIATSTGLAVFNKDIEILAGDPVAIGSIANFARGADNLDNPTSITVVGDYAYVTGDGGAQGGFQILDVSNPAEPIGLGETDTSSPDIDGLTGANAVAIAGNYAYVVASNGNNSTSDILQIIDITDPNNPIGVGSIASSTEVLLDGASDIALQGNYAYVAASDDNAVQILDISDPTNPIGVGNIVEGTSGADELDGASGIAIRGNYAYVAGFGDNGVQILDISDPTNPIGVGSIADNSNGADRLFRANSIALRGNYAYATAEDAVQILDISDPTNPIGVGSIADNSNGADRLDASNSITIIGNYAYVTAENGVQVLDISSSTNPVGVGSIIDGENGADELNGANGISIQGNYAYVASYGDDGVQVLDLGGLITPTAEIGNLLANDIQTDYLRVTQSLTTDGSLNVGQNALIGGSLTITGDEIDTVSDANLVGYWTFDNKDVDLSDDTAEILDRGSSNSTGDWQNDDNLLTTGNFGNAIEFDGVDDYIQLNSFPMSDSEPDFTIAAWIYRATTSGNNTIVSMTGNSANDGNNSQRFRVTPGGNIECRKETDGHVSAETIASDTWYFVACRHTNGPGTLGVSINGQPFATSSHGRGTENPFTMTIGAQNYNGTVSNYFEGLIDEVRVYEEALTDDEIARLYQQSFTKNTALAVTSGNVGIGTTSPFADLSIDGDLAITGALYDSTASAGAVDYVFTTTGGATAWNSLTSLGLGSSSLFTDGGDITYLTSLTDVLSIGTTTDVATSTGLAVYNKDIEILVGQPRGVGSITDGNNGADQLAEAVAVEVVGNYAYVTGYTDDGFQILDISDPTNPVGIGSLASSTEVLLDGAYDIEILGNYAYVSSFNSDSLQVLDISDPTNPIGVGNISDGTKGADTLDGAWGIAVSGEYVYVASENDNGVQIIDISDPTNPIGVSSITDGNNGADELLEASDITVVGNYAYVASLGDNGIQILDISDPTNPIGVGSITDGANGATELFGAVSIEVRGSYAYVATLFDNGFQILDISDPTNPVGLGEVTDGTNGANTLDGARDIALLGDYAYIVSRDDDGLQIIDISSSTNPVGVISLTDGNNGANTLNGAYGIDISGNYAYVVTQVDNGLQILDLGGLITPTAEIGNLLANDIQTDYLRVTQSLVADGSLNVGQNAMIGGTLTVVGNASSSLQGGTTQPALAVTSGNVVIGSVPTTTDIATSTGLAVYNKDIEILAGDPVKVGGVDIGSDGIDLKIMDNYAYVVSTVTGDEFEIFDVSDPTNPVKIGGTAAADASTGIFVQGGYAYVVSEQSGDDFEIFDISNPANPTKIAGIDVDTQLQSFSTHDVVVQGSYAYTAFGTTTGLKIIDVSDPTAPLLISETTTGSAATRLSVQGNYLYISSRADGDDFEVFDISDPYNPFKTDGIDSAGNSYGVDVSGNFAYHAGGGSVRIYDISDPYNITQESVTVTAEYTDDVVLAGNYLYVSSYASTDSLEVFDVSDPAAPVRVGTVDLDGLANSLEVAGNYAYIVSESGADDLQIVDLGGLITPTAEIGNLLANDIETDYLRVTQSLVTDGSLNVGTNALIGGSLTITGTASSSLQAGNTNPALTITSGYVGIGTTSPYADLSIDGDLAITGGIYDSSASRGTSGEVFSSTGSATDWVSFASLGLSASPFTDGGDITYLTSLTDVLAIGTTTDIATSTGLAVYNKDIEILPGNPVKEGGVDFVTYADGFEGVQDIEVVGEYAYVASYDSFYTDGQLQILNISDTKNPTFIASSSAAAVANSVAISGNFAYVVSDSAGDDLEIFDISDTTNPTKVGGADAGADARGVSVAGNFAYVVAGTTDGLQIFDISDPTAPVKVGGEDTASTAYGVTVVGNFAYVVSDSTGDDLEIFDISDPTNPTKVGGADVASSATGVAVSGNYAYVVVATPTDGLQIFDISDPTAPVRVGRTDTASSADDVTVFGNFAYVVSGSPGDDLEIFNISSSTNPTKVGGADGASSATGVAVSGNFAYVVSDSTGDDLEIFDLAGLITPTAEIGNLLANDIQTDYLRVTQALVSDGSLNVGTNAMIGGTLTVVGNASSSLQGGTSQPALAVTSGNVVIGSVPTTTDIATSTGLAVYNKDVEILPGNPVKVGGTDAAHYALDVVVSDSYAYVVSGATGDDLEIFDVSDPTNPSKVGGVEIDAVEDSNGIVVSGQYAYVTTGLSTNGELGVFDISNPTNPTSVSSIAASSSPNDVSVSGNYAYVVSGSFFGGNLEIFDVSDPSNPTRVGIATASSSAQGVAISGSYAYVASGDSGGNLEIFDISDPANPSKVGEAATDAVANKIAVAGNYAYVVTNSTDDDLEIFDISDPSNPTKVGGVDVASTVNSIELAGNYAYLGNGSTLEIIDVSSSTNPVRVGSASTDSGVNGVTISGNYAYVVSDASGDDLEIFDLPGLITPTAEIGNLLANDIQSDFVRVTQSLVTDGSLNIGTNALIGGSLTITGTASSSLQGGNTNPALTVMSGYVGIGTTSPYADLSIDGDLAITGGIYDSTASLGTNRDVFSSTGSATDWVSFASLGLSASPFTDGGDITYLTSLTDVLAIGTTTDIATSTGLAVYNRDIEILAGTPETAGNWDPNDTNVMNYATDVTIAGNYAYVAGLTSDNLAIVDISDPTNPTTTGNWDPNDTNVMNGARRVTIVGNYAYVAGDNSSNLAIVDISDPTNPTTTGNWDPNDTNVMNGARSVTIAGNYAYVTGANSDNLAIVDISDPTNPTTTGNWDPNDTNVMNFATDVTIVGNYAYVAGLNSDNLAIVDISDPTNPTTTGNWDPNDTNVMNGAQGVTIAGNYAYVAGDTSSNLAIVDISDPTNPTTTGNWDPNDGNVMSFGTDVTIAGNYAYVSGTFSSNLAIVDISDPTNPTTTGNWDPNDTNVMSFATDVTIAGNYAYVAGGASSNLAILDLGGLITPTAEIGNLLANDIQTDYLRVTQSLVSDGSLNVGTNAMIGGTLTVVGNASSSLQGGTTQPALAVTSGNVVIGSVPTTTDIATSTGLAVFNKDVEILVGTGTPMYGVGSLADDGALELLNAETVVVQGSYAYVTGLSDGGVQIIDISDPTNPTPAGDINDNENGANDLSGAAEIVVRGNYAYVTSAFDDGLQILDISDPTNIRGVGSIVDGSNGADEMLEAFGLAVQGNYAYVASVGDSGLQIIDISDPTNPIGVGSTRDGLPGVSRMGGARGIEVVGNYAYVVGSTDVGVQILDISDPTNPIGIGSVGIGGVSSAHMIEVAGNYAYVGATNSTDDLIVLDISDPTNPVEVVRLADGDNGADALDNPWEIVAVGNYLYVASNDDHAIQVLDISSSTNPIGVGSIRDGENGADELLGANGLAIQGNYAYVAAYDDSGFQVIDLGGLITPTAEIGNLLATDIETNFLRVTQSLVTDGSLNIGTNALIGGSLTIIGTASSSLQGANTNPALTVTSGYVGIGTTSPYADLSIDGDLTLSGALYDNNASAGTAGQILQTTGSGVEWVASSTLNFPSGTPLFTDGGDISYLTSLTDVLAIGTTTDIATSTGLAVYNRDIEILAGDPTFVGSINTPGDAFDVQVVGDLAYVADNNAGLVIVDVSDPVNPTQIGQYDIALNTANQIKVVGNYAYIADRGVDATLIIDVSNPTNPIEVARTATPNVYGVYVQGGYLYEASQDSDLTIYDISDPTNPIEVGNEDNNRQFISIAVRGNYAYAATTGGNGFYIYDISDPTNPIEISDAFGATAPYGITLGGNYAYMGDSSDGLFIFDISDPNNPFEAGAYDAGLNLYKIKLVGSYIYAGADADGLVVIDVSSSTNPVEVGRYDTPGLAGAVDVVGNYAYVADDATGGLQIFDLGGLITPTAEIGNLLAGDITTDFLRVTQSLMSDSLNVNTNALVGGTLSITGTASSSLIDSNSLTALTITSGFIEIGTTTATSGIQIGYGAICVDNDGECSATTTGRISSVSTYTGNSDLAETYFSSETLEPGTIVELESELSVQTATKESPNTIIGVVSTKPGLLLGFDDLSTRDGEAQYPIGLKGRIPVKVSTENGPIEPGDSLMLSSIPGTAMKAEGTGTIVGIALEAFAPQDENDPYYSDTYINQFTDDLSANDDKDAIVAELEAKTTQTATVTATTTDTNQPDEVEVQTGQIIMFVDLSYRYVDEETSLALNTLMGTTAEEFVGEEEGETVMSRLMSLARNFIDGILSVFSLEADSLEVTDELCINGTCIQADELRVLIERAESGDQITVYEENSDDDISVDVGSGEGDDIVTTPVDNSTTTENTGGSTNEGENGDNSATSTPEISDNGITATTTTGGGDLVNSTTTSTTENPSVEPQNDDSDDVQQNEEVATTPVEDDVTETPEASASADSDVAEEEVPVEEVDTPPAPEPEPVPASDDVNQETP